MDHRATGQLLLALLALGIPAAVVAGQLLARWAGRWQTRRGEVAAGAAFAGLLAIAGLAVAPALAGALSAWQHEPNVGRDGRAEAIALALNIGGPSCGVICLLLTLGFGLTASRTPVAQYGPAPRPLSLRLLAACGPTLVLLGIVAIVALAPPPATSASGFTPEPDAPRARHSPRPSPATSAPPPTQAAGRAASDELMAQLLAVRGPQEPPTAEQLANSAQASADETRTEACPGGQVLSRTVVFTGDDVVSAVQRVLDDLERRDFELVGTLGADLYLPPSTSPLAQVKSGSRGDNAGFITITTRCLRP